MIKRFDACWILLIMGVHVCVEGLRECDLSRPAMLLFSHVSTLDAMIILGTFPRVFCAVVKVSTVDTASQRTLCGHGAPRVRLVCWA